jgi:hypothetical protein
MSDSRLKNNIRRKAVHNLIIFIIGFIILFVAIVVFGPNLLTDFSLYMEGPQGNSGSSNSTNQQNNNTFVAPPNLNPIPNATNKPQINITGIGLKNQTIILFVNGDTVDKMSADSSNKFQFSSVTLQTGQNTIQVKAQDQNNQESDYSNSDTISYLKNPPSLSIDHPQDGQTISKSSSPSINVSGQTDIGAKVTVNGDWAIVDDQGKYNYLYTLQSGDNDIKVMATDAAGNQTTKEIHIHVQ